MYMYDIPVEVRLSAREAIREFAPSMSDDACDKLMLRLGELFQDHCAECERKDGVVAGLEDEIDELRRANLDGADTISTLREEVAALEKRLSDIRDLAK